MAEGSFDFVHDIAAIPSYLLARRSPESSRRFCTERGDGSVAILGKYQRNTETKFSMQSFNETFQYNFQCNFQTYFVGTTTMSDVSEVSCRRSAEALTSKLQMRQHFVVVCASVMSGSPVRFLRKFLVKREERTLVVAAVFSRSHSEAPNVRLYSPVLFTREQNGRNPVASGFLQVGFSMLEASGSGLFEDSRARSQPDVTSSECFPSVCRDASCPEPLKIDVE